MPQNTKRLYGNSSKTRQENLFGQYFWHTNSVASLRPGVCLIYYTQMRFIINSLTRIGPNLRWFCAIYPTLCLTAISPIWGLVGFAFSALRPMSVRRGS